MMTMKEVLNHTPYFIEWTEDVKRLYMDEIGVPEMLESIVINCNTLEMVINYLLHEIKYEYDIETATFLLDDIKDFLMLDL